MSRRALKIAAVVIVIIVSLPLLAYGYAIVSLNGGIANTIRILTPRPNMERAYIKVERETLDARISARLEAIAVASGFKVYASAKDDRCYDGENNWKRTDGYAHRCSLRLTRLLGFGGDFRQTMLDFEKSLLNSGWIAVDRTMEYVLAEYDDRHPVLYRVPPPSGYKMPGLVLDIDWAEGAGTRLQEPDNNQKAQGSFQTFWAEDAKMRLYKLDSNQRIREGAQNFYQRSDYMNTQDAYNNAIRAERYVLSVSIHGHYFEN